MSLVSCGVQEGFVTGPGWWSLKAKARGAGREVLAAADSPLVAVLLGCLDAVELRWFVRVGVFHGALVSNLGSLSSCFQEMLARSFPC